MSCKIHNTLLFFEITICDKIKGEISKLLNEVVSLLCVESKATAEQTKVLCGR